MSTARGTGVPGSGREAGMSLSGTVQQQLMFLNTHWGSKYSFAAPAKPGSRWTAAARFGQHDHLAAESAAELLGLASRFANIPTWFGQSTLQWWGLVRGRLVAARRHRNWPASSAAWWLLRRPAPRNSRPAAAGLRSRQNSLAAWSR
jgi:hypothetical protein